MRERFFEQGERVNKKVEAINRELSDSGISDPSEWRKALDLETPLDENEEKFMAQEQKERGFEIKDFARLLTYLEGGLTNIDHTKIEKFGALSDGLERLKTLQNMSIVEAIEAIRDFGLTDGAWNYLSKRLAFYQKFVAGEATRKVDTQEWDEKTKQYVNVVKEEPLDAEYASPESIKLGVLRDIYYAGMQGTPEMGAVKIATKRVNKEIEQKQQSGSDRNSNSQPIKSVVQFFGYDSGVFEGSLGQYPELNKLYKDCRDRVRSNPDNKDLDEKTIEHKAVKLTARKLQGAFDYNGVLDTSGSPYNAGFTESVVVGQLGNGVMRQMRGMRHKIQETNFSNVERFIGKSGDNKYRGEKKRLDNEVECLSDFVQDNKNYDASHWSVKNEDGNDKQIKGLEAAELMTKQKNDEAIQRATFWFEREREKINRWFEKSNIKIAGYDVSEEERNTISVSVQDRYAKKIADLDHEYQGEVSRLAKRTPDELLTALKERQEIVDKRFEKRKSLAQKALDLHFHFNHEGRDYNSKLFTQIDWINDAKFGTIKRAHKALKIKDLDDQTVMMRALAEVNGQSPDEQDSEKFVFNMIKSGDPNRIVENFEKFSGIQEDKHLNIVLELIKNHGGYSVIQNFEKFSGIQPTEHLQVVNALNTAGDGQAVVENFEKFSGIQEADKKTILMNAIKGGGGYSVVNNFEKYVDVFTEADHTDMVMEMIKAGNAYYLNYDNTLDKFTGLQEPLRQVIKTGKYEALPHVLEAGFTIDEITRFPFLISPLVTKK